MKKIMVLVSVVLSLSVVVCAQMTEGWYYDEASHAWCKPPFNWQKTQLKGTVGSSQRFSEPQANAFVEFMSRAENPQATAESVADAWEKDSKQFLPYLEKQISSSALDFTGGSGVLRQYEGSYYGTLLNAYVLYAVAHAKMYVVAGVFAKEKKAVYEPIVKKAVLSFRLIAPAQEKIAVE